MVANSSRSEPITTPVVEGTVGQQLGVAVTVLQPVHVVATNTLSGMVTMVSSSTTVDVGDVLYRVGSIPVRVVEGDVPFYRELDLGTRGVDVLQLSTALETLGYFSDGPTDEFDTNVASAVRRWQHDLGIPETGSILYGELLSVSVLPAQIRLGESLKLGVPSGGGEPAIIMKSGLQEFSLVISTDQAQYITQNVQLVVYFESFSWAAVVSGGRVNESSFTEYKLTSPQGGSVCGEDCSSLPTDEQLSLRADAIIVPDISGPSVPVSSVRTGADGSTYVVMIDGSRRSVSVLGSSRGIAVVEGVAIGENVVVVEGSG
jgi:peptidoglycan hydrolase-like protein with peptidoglycan-binding domain